MEKFPEKYRFQILISNLDFFKKEDEEDQEDILKLLPEEARTIFRECIKGENQSTPSITTSYYSFSAMTKMIKHRLPSIHRLVSDIQTEIMTH